ncbi:MAG: glycosyltransferase involved in cell wall biosynthesis [Parvicella sp.]|jgi:glycosyltransferase involved in cell wall biosynthesis
MRIALIGNMNNNNFAVMRYCRDLGIDAHLFLYSTDGRGSLSHFKPESDTWNIDKWQPYIHQTEFENGPLSGSSGIWSILVRLINIIPFKGKRGDGLSSKYARNKQIRNKFESFDYTIGTGIAAALFHKAGLRLSCFVPYGAGIEFVGALPYQKRMSKGVILKRMIFKNVFKNQLNGVRNSNYCFNAELGLTKDVLDSYRIKFENLAMPMVYNNEILKSHEEQNFKGIIEQLKEADYRIISHGRQYWVNPGGYSKNDWESRSKHNEWLINSFSRIIGKKPDINPILVLLEYGDDFEHTKALCKKLGIEDSVVWLGKMNRREIMKLIRHCDLGIGEFYKAHGTIWGGTGWEILSCGKPFVQGFNFNEGEFESSFGHPPPPILGAKTERDVETQIIKAINNPEWALKIGKESEDWFNAYNGIELTKNWLRVICDENELPVGFDN